MAIDVGERRFIGIGKIMLDFLGEDWHIPNLHFLVSKCDDAVFEAVNLEFGLVSIGGTSALAAQGLATLLCTHILFVVKEGAGFQELRETARKQFMCDYWAEYRGIEFDLAEKGEDLSHYLDKKINKAIVESFTAELRKALEEKAGGAADEIVRMITVRPPVVEYKELRTAA